MIIQLDRIVFDHTAGAQTDGLTIRIDRVTPAPDWIRGAAQTSYAAYALIPTENQQVSIQADFSFPLPPPAPIQVRARAVDQNDRVLGNVVDTPVPQAGGRIAFNLADVQMWDRGTGRYAVSWQWQFQIGGSSSWIDLARTDHVVFVTLDVPSDPWTQGVSLADQPLWPWVRVLTWACAWGQGVTLTSTGKSGAAKKLARRLETGLHEQGRRQSVPLQYLDADQARYTADSPAPLFFCTAFLDLLDGSPQSDFGTEVNCSDCASALATFANALGCDVTQKRISHKDHFMLRTNRIVLIGESDDDDAETHWFGYHEFVARRRASDNAALIHDACLKIDTDSDPTRTDEDHRFDLAEGMALGAFIANPPQFMYAHRVFEPEQWSAGVVDDLDFRCLDDCAGQAKKVDAMFMRRYERIRADLDQLGPAGDAAGPRDLRPPVLPGFALYDVVENPRQWANLGPLVTRSVDYFYVAAGEDADREDRRLRLSVAYSDSATKARDALAWMLAQAPARAPFEAHGGLTVAMLRNSAMYLIRGNTLARALNVGRDNVQLESLVPVLDEDMEHRAQNGVAVPVKR
jgi:hypothetical protein